MDAKALHGPRPPSGDAANEGNDGDDLKIAL
jgi:hypothetical protein